MDAGVIGHFTGEHLEASRPRRCGRLRLRAGDPHGRGLRPLRDRPPDARVHSEAFTLAVPAAVDPNEPVHGELSFTASGTSAANDGRTILDQAESAGLSPESGCRMGICFSCTAIKKSGCTRNVLTGETDTESDTQIQLCINAPVGDVEIEV